MFIYREYVIEPNTMCRGTKSSDMSPAHWFSSNAGLILDFLRFTVKTDLNSNTKEL